MQNNERASEMINTQYWLATGTTFNYIKTQFNWKRSGYPLLKLSNYPGKGMVGCSISQPGHRLMRQIDYNMNIPQIIR